MKKFFAKCRTLCALLAFAVGQGAMAQDYVPKYELIDKASFPTNDLAVATCNVLDYGADPTGETDCTTLFQTLLDKLAGVGTVSNERGNHANKAGGILYIPEGKYLCKGQLVIPRGVTMRGDWAKPGADGQKGTIIMVTGYRGKTLDTQAFITMQVATEVSNISFWYPEQDINDIKAYPPTILYGQSNYWGNEYCNVRHVTFINSYGGIHFNTSNGGGCPNIFDIYGTPLHTGVIMDCIADVGRFDGIHFSPSYWANSGMDGAPSEAEVRSYTRSNATGFTMRRNDWSYLCNYDCDGYNTAYLEIASVSDGSKPNGHNYNLNFTNCETGIDIQGMSYCGCLFANVNTRNCTIGVDVKGGGDGPAQFYGCDIRGNQCAIVTEKEWGSAVLLQNCKVSGPTVIIGGTFNADNNTFSGDVTIGGTARTVFTGNTFSTGKLVNNSIFECEVSDKGSSAPALAEFKDEWMAIKTTRPAKAQLYVVTDFGAESIGINDDLAKAKDNTSAIQAALDKAGQEGGGIVYLPSGHYRVNGNLNIPAGVELKGSSDLATVPKGNGAILEVYNNEGKENADPFITMGKGSGLRGITINYPNQTDPVNVKLYPYAVRGNADCYIVNLAMRAAYRGVDLFTNKCDRHYVDFLSGHAFKNVINVGNGAKDGIISNIQCNTIAYACGNETKFGAWSNSMAGGKFNQNCYAQNMEDLDFMIIDDCTDEILYNNFLYGCNKGMIFGSADNVAGAKNLHSLGNAVDGAVNTIVINKLASNLDLVNSQVVALNHTDNVLKKSCEAYFVTTGSKLDKTVNFINSDHWGGGNYFAKVEGGTVNFYNINADQFGEKNTFNVATTANVTMSCGRVSRMTKLVSKQGSVEPRLALTSTIIDPTGFTRSKMKAYTNNISHTWELQSGSSSLLSRSGWTAMANNDASGTAGKARKAIDGDADSRWDTGAGQKAGQWFAVNMKSKQTFNTVTLDASASAADGPAEYEVLVGNNSDTKQNDKVASGKNGGAMLFISFPTQTAQYVRVNQTGKKGNYWSIHEFYVGNISETSSIGSVEMDDIVNTSYYTADGKKINSVSQVDKGVLIEVKTDSKGNRQTKKYIVQ